MALDIKNLRFDDFLSFLVQDPVFLHLIIPNYYRKNKKIREHPWENIIYGIMRLDSFEFVGGLSEVGLHFNGTNSRKVQLLVKGMGGRLFKIDLQTLLEYVGGHLVNSGRNFF